MYACTSCVSGLLNSVTLILAKQQIFYNTTQLHKYIIGKDDFNIHQCSNTQVHGITLKKLDDYRPMYLLAILCVETTTLEKLF